MDCFVYEMFYVNFMVTTKQRSRVYSQKIKKGEAEHTTTENYQFTKASRNRKRNTGNTKPPESN